MFGNSSLDIEKGRKVSSFGLETRDWNRNKMFDCVFTSGRLKATPRDANDDDDDDDDT